MLHAERGDAQPSWSERAQEMFPSCWRGIRVTYGWRTGHERAPRGLEGVLRERCTPQIVTIWMQLVVAVPGSCSKTLQGEANARKIRGARWACMPSIEAVRRNRGQEVLPGLAGPNV